MTHRHDHRGYGSLPGEYRSDGSQQPAVAPSMPWRDVFYLIGAAAWRLAVLYAVLHAFGVYP